MPYRIFFSYAHADAKQSDLVKRFYERICEKYGEGVAFLDEKNLRLNSVSFSDEIAERIKECEKVILFIGTNFPNSVYARSELDHALKHGRKIVPILFANDEPDLATRIKKLVPVRFQKKHIEDFSSKTEEEIIESMDKVIENLMETITSGSLPSNLRTLPLNYLPRYEQIVKLEDLFFKEEKSVADTLIGGLWGGPGLGKSVIANAFCRDGEILSAFIDGVCWINVKQSGSLKTAFDEIRKEYGPDFEKVIKNDDSNSNYNEEVGIKKVLRKFFSSRKSLIVLDDVWKENSLIIKYFHEIIDGTKNKILVTSRDKSIFIDLNMKYVELDALSEDEAEGMMLRASGEDRLDESAKEILQQLRGHTLSCVIVCAMRRDGLSWDDILIKLKESRKSLLMEKKDVDYDYNNLLTAIDASVKALEQKDRDFYRRLAVFNFEDDSSVPLSAVSTIWRKRYPELSDSEAEDRIRLLQRKCLLDYNDQSDTRNKDQSGNSFKKTISLHDLEYDYLQKTVDRIDGLHREFVDVYQRICNGEWTSIPRTDTYYYSRIIYHMLNGGSADIAKKCLCDYDWIKRKMSVCGCTAVLSDYEYAKSRIHPESHLLDLIRRAIFLSAAFLSEDYRQLPTHLVGRMVGIKDQNIEAFLEQIYRKENDFWLRPTAACMFQADADLVNQWCVDSSVLWMNSSPSAPGRFAIALIEDDDKKERTARDRTEYKIIELFDEQRNEPIFYWKDASEINYLYLESKDCVLSTDNEGNVKYWHTNKNDPEIINVTDEPIVFIDKTHDDLFLYVTRSGRIIYDENDYELKHKIPAASYFLFANDLYVGYTDGHIGIVSLRDFSERCIQVSSPDQIVDAITVNNAYVAYELTEKAPSDNKTKKSIIRATSLLEDDYRYGNKAMLTEQKTKTGGLQFISEDMLIYTNGIHIYARSISEKTDHVIALNEHWIYRSALLGQHVLCSDNYGRIYCYDATQGIANEFKMYDTHQLNPMINTECIGTLETGIRGVILNSINLISDPKYRKTKGIDQIRYCMAITPQGVLYAGILNVDKDPISQKETQKVGALFFNVGEKRPIIFDKVSAMTLCAVCFDGKPMIGTDQGDILQLDPDDPSKMTLYCKLRSEVSVIGTDGKEQVFCSSGKTLYKPYYDKKGKAKFITAKTRGVITHISVMQGIVACVYGDNKMACFSSKDLRPIRTLSAKEYDPAIDISSAMVVASYVVFSDATGKLYQECLGDYLIEHNLKHNKKDRKVVLFDDLIVFCDGPIKDDPTISSKKEKYSLMTKKLGSENKKMLTSILSAIFQTITRYDQYAVAASQRDRIDFWDPDAGNCLRAVSTDSMIRSLSTIGDYMAFVSGSHIFWLEIKNKERIKTKEP